MLLKGGCCDVSLGKVKKGLHQEAVASAYTYIHRCLACCIVTLGINTYPITIKMYCILIALCCFV